MDDNKLKKLDEVQERLYSKEFKDNAGDFNQFKRKEDDYREDWGEMDNQDRMKNFQKIITIKKILIMSIIFFVGAFAMTVFKFSNGSNVVSIDDVDVVLDGPVSVRGGEQFDFNVKVSNNSVLPVEYANLFIQYPSGSYTSFDSEKELVRGKVDLGRLMPSDDIENTFPVVFFGEENIEKEIIVTIELRFQDSNATLEKTEVYSIKIASSPVNLFVSVPQETNLNQEFEIVVDLESNSNQTMKNLLLNIDYPFGFEFKSATPESSSNDNIWDVGDLPPSSKRTIKIRGILDGLEGAEKEFNVSVGSKDSTNAGVIGTVYNSVSELTRIAKPFIGLNILLDGNSANEFISGAERIVRVDVLWNSNIDTRIVDGRIEVKLEGDVIDKFSVSVGGGGFYRSIDNTIIWDKVRSQNLSVIEPSSSGSVSFSLKSLPLVDSSSNVYSNPEITIKALASGKRISDLNVPEEVNSFTDKKIKIESGLALSSRIVHHSGPFINTGPLPPKAENETTYTVIWTITNSSNMVSSSVVNMVLPPYVRWTGVVSPENESVSFNEAGGEVIWNVGNIERGVGITGRARELAFQIAFLPSVSQVGTSPLLTGQASIFGKDNFTGTTLRGSTRALSTRLTNDPSFSESEANVSF